MGSRGHDVELFCEDESHERFVGALVHRIASEHGTNARVSIRSARGGHGRAMDELRLYLRACEDISPKLLVIAIDANCQGWNKARSIIEERIPSGKFPCRVVACPDPHIERWFMADPESLASCLGVRIAPKRRKCERDLYKNEFLKALRDAGQVVTLGGPEFAPEIVSHMDLHRAGRNEPSLKHVIEGLRAHFGQIRADIQTLAIHQE